MYGHPQVAQVAVRCATSHRYDVADMPSEGTMAIWRQSRCSKLQIHKHLRLLPAVSAAGDDEELDDQKAAAVETAMSAPETVAEFDLGAYHARLARDAEPTVRCLPVNMAEHVACLIEGSLDFTYLSHGDITHTNMVLLCPKPALLSLSYDCRRSTLLTALL